MAIGPIASFLAGLIAFFSPCVLPIVPGFLAYVVGQDTGRFVRLMRTFTFVLGFTAAFSVIGFLIGAVGGTASFQSAEVWLRRIGGALVIGFGFVMLGLLHVPFLDRDVRFHGKMPAWLGRYGGAFALGAAFGVGWTPCVGPVLASILVLAGLEGSATLGAGYLALFALGLAIPFLLFGLAADRGAGFLRKHGKATQVVEIIGGVFLVLLGIAVFTGAANRLLSGVAF